VTELAVGGIWPDLTLLLMVPHELSEERRQIRGGGRPGVRDRFEESDRAFFDRVEQGYRAVAAAEPQRIQVIAADAAPETVEQAVWAAVAGLLEQGPGA